MKQLHVYLAGKVNSTSSLAVRDWRDKFCDKLTTLSGIELINLDPTKADRALPQEQYDGRYIFGRDAWLIKSADVVIVNLTDDISVGGAQEMLIAKHFAKPLIGLAPPEGKFNRTEKVIGDKTYHDYINPFVLVPCDKVAENLSDVAKYLQALPPRSKDLSVIDEAVAYYEKTR